MQSFSDEQREVYFNDYQGKQVTKSGYSFAARNINHAIRRMVKTVTKLPAMHIRFNVWSETGESVHVYINQVFGQSAGITVNDVFYPAASWVENFPG